MGERLLLTREEGGKTLELYQSTDQNLEVFVDGMHGSMVASGVIKLNWFTRRFDSSEEVEKRDLVCQTTMSLETFFNIADYFSKHAEKIKADLASDKEEGKG
ncbi:hypothetical protein [Thiohalorhabdus sp.]|uniref:hypothetical protein n=1 Tax=Thiohalorhabdus sp. TaxID=3094134 RepID=UPI002FC2D0AC